MFYIIKVNVKGHVKNKKKMSRVESSGVKIRGNSCFCLSWFSKTRLKRHEQDTTQDYIIFNVKYNPCKYHTTYTIIMI